MYEKKDDGKNLLHYDNTGLILPGQQIRKRPTPSVDRIARLLKTADKLELLTLLFTTWKFGAPWWYLLVHEGVIFITLNRFGRVGLPFPVSILHVAAIAPSDYRLHFQRMQTTQSWSAELLRDVSSLYTTTAWLRTDLNVVHLAPPSDTSLTDSPDLADGVHHGTWL